MTISELLFLISSITKFHANFNFNIILLCICLSNIFTIAKPEISSINGTSTLTNFCSFGFKIILSFGNRGMDLFKKLKQHSHEFYYFLLYLLLSELQKVCSHIVHFLLGSSEFLKQTLVMNEAICNTNSVIWT